MGTDQERGAGVISGPKLREGPKRKVTEKHMYASQQDQKEWKDARKKKYHGTNSSPTYTSGEGKEKSTGHLDYIKKIANHTPRRLGQGQKEKVKKKNLRCWRLGEAWGGSTRGRCMNLTRVCYRDGSSKMFRREGKYKTGGGGREKHGRRRGWTSRKHETTEWRRGKEVPVPSHTVQHQSKQLRKRNPSKRDRGRHKWSKALIKCKQPRDDIGGDGRNQEEGKMRGKDPETHLRQCPLER